MFTTYILSPLLLGGCLLGPPKPTPDLIIAANVIPTDLTQTSDEVLLVTHGQLAGRMSAAKAQRKYSTTPQLSADAVSAGLVDAHGHPAGLGRAMTELNLSGTQSFAEVLQYIEAKAKAPAKPESWLLGRGWDQNDWDDPPAGQWPTAALLDAIEPSRPVALRRIDGHALWVNSKALTLAGVSSNTPDPKGGWIFRDEQGKPTGILLDAAMSLIPVPTPTVSDREEHLKAAFGSLIATGLTGVHAMGVQDSTLQALRALDERDELPLRIWVYVGAGTQAAQVLLNNGPEHTEHVKIIGIKAVADGALGSRGALLSQDYSDAPKHKGLSLLSEDDIAKLAASCLRSDVQLAVHAIGDAAVTQVLNAFERARTEVPEKHHVPLRLEHAQVVKPEDRPRFAEHNIIASMQPTHAVSDGPWAPDRLGSQRMPWAYAFKALKTAGATLAFGSDFPVEEHAPLLGLQAACQTGCEPGRCLTTDEALLAFTTGCAQATANALPAGLSTGSPADLTLWEGTEQGAFPFRPIATIVGGTVVWSAR